MNVLQNLIELYNHLSQDSTYRDVVKGILLNLEEASKASIYELADMTNSSRTTIWRMLKKLGYENYADFRRALKYAVGKFTFYNRIFPSKASRTDEGILDHTAKELALASEVMKDDLQSAPLMKTAALVSRKKQVFFYFPYCSSAIYSFQQNLAFAGIETCAVCLLPEMMDSAGMTGPDTLVFCSVIEHAETMDMTPLFELLHKNKAEVALFASEDSFYADCADYLLCSDKEDGGVLSGLLRVDLYLFALSEVFRREYL